MNPFRRRTRDTGDSSVESALRTSLARHAFETPDADDVTRRVLAAAALASGDDTADIEDASATVIPFVSRSERGVWKTWGLPLVAAAAVIAVVGVGAAIASYDNGNGHTQQAATQAPSTPHTTVTETQTVTSRPKQTRTAVKQAGTSGLTNVKIIDLTFYHQDSGIALASADCLTGSGRCLALLQTTDGTTWMQKGGTFGFDVRGITAGCPASKCVDHIRFATDLDGYAYGPDAFFMTKDGGNTWHQQPGGAAALESLDNNVIRVSTTSAGCLSGCRYSVSTSAIGGDTWTPVSLPDGTPTGDGVQVSRGGSYAYLLVTQNPAGGASDASSTLYASTDDGAAWTNEHEPCPGLGTREVDSYQVSAGEGPDVSVLCRARATGPYLVAVSTDAGARFALRSGTIAHADVAATGYSDSGGALPNVLVGDPSTALAVAGRGVSISHNGGTSWHQAADLVGTFASVGFESTTVGRAVSADGTQIWTTRDAGKSWHESTP